MHRMYALAVIACSVLATGPSFAGETAAIEPFLLEGRLDAGEAMLLEQLRSQPKNSEAQLSLGVTRALQAIEGLGQNLYQHGSRPRAWFALNLLGRGGGLPILRMPIPKNPEPKPIDYDRFREIVAQFQAGLEKADSTLAMVNDEDLKLPLNFGRIRLDLDGDGMGEPGEELWRVYGAINGQARRVPADSVREFHIVLDQADAHWLRGYCNLLAGICEVILAYDESELFNKCAFMIFPKAVSPIEHVEPSGDFIQAIIDEVAAVHLASFPVKHPERLVKAHRHFRSVIAQSRAMWAAIERETDNDREWIPGPHQTSIVPGVRISKEMVAGWKEFLREADDVLEGKKLIPFWRGKNQRLGVNLRKVFHEPSRLDLILWFNGAAALPYLEEGDVTKPEVWERFNRIFRGEFIGFAIWIN